MTHILCWPGQTCKANIIICTFCFVQSTVCQSQLTKSKQSKKSATRLAKCGLNVIFILSLWIVLQLSSCSPRLVFVGELNNQYISQTFYLRVPDFGKFLIGITFYDTGAPQYDNRVCISIKLLISLLLFSHKFSESCSFVAKFCWNMQKLSGECGWVAVFTRRN